MRAIPERLWSALMATAIDAMPERMRWSWRRGSGWESARPVINSGSPDGSVIQLIPGCSASGAKACDYDLWAITEVEQPDHACDEG